MMEGVTFEVYVGAMQSWERVTKDQFFAELKREKRITLAPGGDWTVNLKENTNGKRNRQTSTTRKDS